MTTEIVRIGNSRGIRIPKPILDICGFDKTVEIEVEDGRLIVSGSRAPRQGWDEAFKRAGSSADDELLLDGVVRNRFDRSEWKW